jgi:hypothetical protein
MMRYIQLKNNFLLQICIVAITLLAGCVESLEPEDVLEEETSLPAAEITEDASLPLAALDPEGLLSGGAELDAGGVEAQASAPRACTAATTLLHVTIASTTLTCAAAAAEDFLNPIADAKCAGGIASLTGAVISVINQCGTTPPNPGLLPPGSYQRSCSRCSYDFVSGRLRCTCKKRNGSITTSKFTNIPVCAKSITNCDGVLKCASRC